MKKVQLIGLLTIVLATTCLAQTADSKMIKATIHAFAKAGDNSNADELAKYLDDNYRVVMNRLFGSNTVGVLSKSVYLEKIRSKEFGGDSRKITIERIQINGNTACAKVAMAGQKMTFVSLLTMVKDDNGMWKLIGDMPVVK